MKFKQRFDNIPRIPRSKIVPAITDTTRRASADIKDDLQMITPVDTGLMRRSWERRVTNTTRGVTLTLENTASYAGHVHYKGRPHSRVMAAAARLFDQRAAELADTVNDRLTLLIRES
jgi:hypothetical protein